MEMGFSNGEEGAYYVKNVSLAQMIVPMAQTKPSGTEKGAFLTNGVANKAEGDATSAESNVSGEGEGVWRSGQLRHKEG